VVRPAGICHKVHDGRLWIARSSISIT